MSEVRPSKAVFGYLQLFLVFRLFDISYVCTVPERFIYYSQLSISSRFNLEEFDLGDRPIRLCVD